MAVCRVTVLVAVAGGCPEVSVAGSAGRHDSLLPLLPSY